MKKIALILISILILNTSSFATFYSGGVDRSRLYTCVKIYNSCPEEMKKIFIVTKTPIYLTTETRFVTYEANGEIKYCGVDATAFLTSFSDLSPLKSKVVVWFNCSEYSFKRIFFHEVGHILDFHSSTVYGEFWSDTNYTGDREDFAGDVYMYFKGLLKGEKYYIIKDMIYKILEEYNNINVNYTKKQRKGTER